MRITGFLLAALPGLLIATLIGCSNTTPEVKSEVHGHEHDHDHSDRPNSLHAAVAELTEMRDAIRDAIVDGNPGDAHGPLHEVDELLEAIPDIAAETDLPKEEWDAVNAANDELFTAFGAIDKAFHTKDGDKKTAYEGVAGKLDAAIEAIRARLAFTGEDPTAVETHVGHDHDEEHSHGDSDSTEHETSAGDAS